MCHTTRAQSSAQRLNSAQILRWRVMDVDFNIEGGSLALALTSDVLCVLSMGDVRWRECEHWDD